MQRIIYQKLLEWKNDKDKKPLILQGARQVGKTFLVSEFGRKEYKNFIYLNFEQNHDLASFFSGNIIPEKIIENIALYFGKKINAEDTLLFFDEIQAVSQVLTSLKYFYEYLPEYHIVAAGSLLGVSVGKLGSFPVGKVNFLQMYPMSFYEFLMAAGENLLVQNINAQHTVHAFPAAIHEKLSRYYKEYLFVGGMPEAVKVYFETRDVKKVRKIHIELLKAYFRDFSKYTDKKQAIKTAELWHSVPAQLSRENKKFKYSEVRKKARAVDFEQTIEWLKGAGLINVAYNISVPKLPLSAYAYYDKFKIYLFDTGLLGAMLNLSSKMIAMPDAIFKQYNGAFIENFVAQELTFNNIDLYYWKSKSDAEIDFIIENKGVIYPLEVKSGTSLNLKSLQSYEQKYQPELKIRVSPRNYIQSGNFVNLPLYLVSSVKKLFNQD